MFAAQILQIVILILEIARDAQRDMPAEMKQAHWANVQKDLDFWRKLFHPDEVKP